LIKHITLSICFINSLSERRLIGTVGICFPDLAVRVLSDPRTIREQYIFLPIGEFDRLDSVFLDPLYGSIREDALFLAVGKYAFNCSVREDNLLSSIYEVFLNLVVSELEDLQTINESSLSGLSIGEVVNNSLVWIGLLNVTVVEVNDSVAIWEHFSLDAIIEDNFLLSIFVDPLDFTIVAYDLLYHFHV